VAVAALAIAEDVDGGQLDAQAVAGRDVARLVVGDLFQRRGAAAAS